jgi:hypothetical protein
VYGSGFADAESQRDHDHGCEARGLAELPYCVTKIVQQAVHADVSRDAGGNRNAILFGLLTGEKRDG